MLSFITQKDTLCDTRDMVTTKCFIFIIGGNSKNLFSRIRESVAQQQHRMNPVLIVTYATVYSLVNTQGYIV